MFAVAEHFLQCGSISIMKHTMSISQAKLVSEGPESLRPQPCSSQQSSDGALPTSSESNTSGDVDESADDSEKAGGDASVHAETVLEELVKREEDMSAVPPCTATEVVKPEGVGVSAVPPSTATEVVKPEGEDLSAVPPSTATEVVKPEGEDASAVLPMTATEVVKPEGEGVSAVLPSTATEVVKPEGEDVSVVPPSTATDVVKPEGEGVSAVPPSTATEVVKPEGEGVSAVPPSTATEVVKPEGEGVSAVLPSTATEVAKPEGEDVSAVPPSTATEVVKPEGEDASAVPPSTATEVVKPEGHDVSAVLPSTATEVVKPEGYVNASTVSNVVSDEQLSGAGDGSEFLDIQDVAAECSDPAVKAAQSDTQSETTVMSGGTAVDQDQSEGHELEKVHHDEYRRSDDEPVATCDTEQSDAAVQDTVDDAAPDGESAPRCSEVDHITDQTSIDDQTLAAGSIVPGQSAVVEQSMDIDMLAAAGSETDELAEEAVTVLVSNIPRGLDETVEMYLESRKKGGGKVLSFEYNERRGSALVVFADNAGNFNFCLISAHVIKSCL